MKTFDFEQNAEKSCGAACLLVAAKELGINEMTFNGDRGSFGLTHYAETVVYQMRADPSDGYMMPSDIGTIARKAFGLDAKVYMYGAVLPRVLQGIYPEARRNCEKAEIAVINGKPHLTADQREIRAVMVGLVFGLHWILCRPGDQHKSYMDPAEGKTFSRFRSMGQLTVFKYVSTGISVVLTPP